MAHHRASPSAAPVFPLTARNNTAGTHTSAVPMPGMTDSTTITVPQNTAPWIPTTAKASPARLPWTMPIASVPLSVARETVTNLSTSSCWSDGFNGTRRMALSSVLRPFIRKKNSE